MKARGSVAGMGSSSHARWGDRAKASIGGICTRINFLHPGEGTMMGCRGVLDRSRPREREPRRLAEEHNQAEHAGRGL